MPDPNDEHARRIHERSRSCLAAMNRGDIEAVMDHYADDAILLFGSVPPVRGAAAIRRHWEQTAAADRLAELDTESITVTGTHAYEVAFYRVLHGDVVVASGKNVVVWRRDGDRWNLLVDICTEDAAGAAPA